MSTEDLVFLIRHDTAKVNRLKEFLSWKDVRKNVKNSDDADLVEDVGMNKSLLLLR
jgi:transcription initiation protein SPT3